MIQEDFLWTEKFRPKKVSETILPDDLKATFQAFVDDGTVPNLLLVGSSGVGKTTIAKAMLNELEADYIVINGSMNGNIDTLRNEILNFASSVSFSGGRKYVILDECLDENTLVWVLRKGEICKVPISLLNDEEDLVKSFNLETRRIEWKPFVLFDKGEQETLEIEFENGEIVICTPDHKWYVEDEKGDPIVIKASELDKYGFILTEEDHLNGVSDRQNCNQ